MMKSSKNNRLITICFVSLLILFLAVGIFLTGKKNKTATPSDNETKESLEETGEAVENSPEQTAEETIAGSDSEVGGDDTSDLNDSSEAEPTEPAQNMTPEEVVSSAAYKEGMLGAAESFKSECAEIFAGYNSDLARFSMMDVDKDGIPELIMHDIAGRAAYYISFAGGTVTEKQTIFESSNDINNSTDINSYAALYKDKNLFIRYEIAKDGKSSESYFYSIDPDSKEPVLLNSLSWTEKGLLGDEKFKSNDANISRDEYINIFKEYLGEDDYNNFFLDDLMMADGEYDFRSETTWNSTPGAEHLTYEELVQKLN